MAVAQRRGLGAVLRLGYQETDAHLVDYQLYQLPGIELSTFRGPPVRREAYVACIGAAQTFGRLAHRPFPALISSALDIDSLNLGRGGAGPGYTLRSPAMMRYINDARLVIVQVLSGRSVSNSIWHTVNDGVLGVNQVTGTPMRADEFYTWLLQQELDYARQIVAESRANYVATMTRMLSAIKPPKILLWFSTRAPDYRETWALPPWRLFGKYPQLVNRAMVESVKPFADRYVECVSYRGLPHRVIDLAGNPSAYHVLPSMDPNAVPQEMNRYYPSQEMHEDAADLLIPACRELLGLE